MTAPARSRPERAARLAALALLLLAPAVYLPRVLASPDPRPTPPRPRFARLVVITAARLPERLQADAPGFVQLARRCAFADQCYSPARSTAGAAASLWTGRYPAHHGVARNEHALSPDAWTLAEAERRAGGVTAAYLEEPFVSATGIRGFGRVEEARGLGAVGLAERGAAFLREHPEQRACLWLHLADAGPGGRELARLVQELDARLADPFERYAALVVVTALGREVEPRLSPGFRAADAAARVPLWVRLPGGMNAGLSSRGASSLVEVAGAACELLLLPRPAPGEAPLQMDGQNLWRNLGGGASFPWLLVEGAGGPVLRFGRTRVAPSPHGGVDAESTSTPREDDGFGPATDEQAVQLRGQYELVLRRLGDGAEEPRTARVPAPWADGW